nr:uncharacterized protein LOC123761876 [Procambarus clarkii]
MATKLSSARTPTPGIMFPWTLETPELITKTSQYGMPLESQLGALSESSLSDGSMLSAGAEAATPSELSGEPGFGYLGANNGSLIPDSCGWAPSASHLVLPEEASISHDPHSALLSCGDLSTYQSSEVRCQCADVFGGDEYDINDITTWDPQVIREVAACLDRVINSGQTADMDSQPLAPATRRQPQVVRSEGVPSQRWDQPVPGSSSNVPRRKIKLYQLSPQEDPELERRRRLALKQYLKRLRDEKHERTLICQFKNNSQEVASLNQEKQTRLQTIAMLEALLTRSSIVNPHGQHDGEVNRVGASGYNSQFL